MHIQSYQIQNVLNQCCRRLEKDRSESAWQRSPAGMAPGDRVQISIEGRRQAIMEKVVDGIMDRIANLERQVAHTNPNRNSLPRKVSHGYDQPRSHASEFVYKRIDGAGRQIADRLESVDFSTLLTQVSRRFDDGEDAGHRPQEG